MPFLWTLSTMFTYLSTEHLGCATSLYCTTVAYNYCSTYTRESLRRAELKQFHFMFVLSVIIINAVGNSPTASTIITDKTNIKWNCFSSALLRHSFVTLPLTVNECKHYTALVAARLNVKTILVVTVLQHYAPAPRFPSPPTPPHPLSPHPTLPSHTPPGISVPASTTSPSGDNSALSKWSAEWTPERSGVGSGDIRFTVGP